MATIDDLYRQLSEILPPNDLESIISDALILDCGFIVEKGKPGTLRTSQFVPANTLITIDVTKMNEMRNITFPTWERAKHV